MSPFPQESVQRDLRTWYLPSGLLGSVSLKQPECWIPHFFMFTAHKIHEIYKAHMMWDRPHSLPSSFLPQQNCLWSLLLLCACCTAWTAAIHPAQLAPLRSPPVGSSLRPGASGAPKCRLGFGQSFLSLAAKQGSRSRKGWWRAWNTSPECGGRLVVTEMSAHLSLTKNSELRQTQQLHQNIVATGMISSELYQIYLKQYKALLPEVTFPTEEAAGEHLLQVCGALSHWSIPEPRVGFQWDWAGSCKGSAQSLLHPKFNFLMLKCWFLI